MPIPDFQTLMRPLLALHEDDTDHQVREIRAMLTDQFGLTEEEKQQRLPSGSAKTFDNRVRWATTYLHKTGLLSKPRSAVYRITERGRRVLAENPDRIDLHVLDQFPELRQFRSGTLGAVNDVPAPDAVEDVPPQEAIERAVHALDSELASELLERIVTAPPDFFEQVVVDVLLAMRYGGTHEDTAKRLGRSGDEGVDGVITADPLA